MTSTVVSTTKEQKCPYCKSMAIDRRRRPFLVRTALFFLPLKYYRCDRCQRRFYLFD